MMLIRVALFQLKQTQGGRSSRRKWGWAGQQCFSVMRECMLEPMAFSQNQSGSQRACRSWDFFRSFAGAAMSQPD